jgi:S-adenosylmethionine synthetase
MPDNEFLFTSESVTGGHPDNAQALREAAGLDAIVGA